MPIQMLQHLVDTGRYADAINVFENLSSDLDRKSRFEASLLASTAYAELAAKEPDADKRFELFNNAVRVLRRQR
jgi:hypothetical protein